MISFNEPISGTLSPNHYIEIAKDPGGADGKAFSQPQRVLLCFESFRKNFYKASEASEIKDREEEQLNSEKNHKPDLGSIVLTKTKATKNIKNKAEALAAMPAPMSAAKSVYKSVELYVLWYKQEKLEEALKELPEEQFTQIALDKPTQQNIDAITTELDQRWKSDSQLDGHLFVSYGTEKAPVVDSKHVTLIKRKDVKSTDAIWSASFAALNAQYATEPSRPYSTLKVPGLTSNLRSNLETRNALLKSGVSTYKTNISEEVFVDRLITTSKDPEYRSLEVKQTLSAIRYDLRKYFETRFNRYMLVKDNHPHPGPVLSPKSIKTLLVARYRLYQSQNLVQDDGNIGERIRVEVSKSNPSKVDIFFPVITMGQLLITQTQIAFRT